LIVAFQSLARTRTTTILEGYGLEPKVNSNLQQASAGLTGEVLVKKQLTTPPAS
jgi:hypothetical protein